MIDLHEQIICELIEDKEIEPARLFLHDTPTMIDLKKSNPPRYRRIENLCHSAITFIINEQKNVGMDISPLTALDIYRCGSRESGRADLSDRILPHTRECLGSRLMTLVQAALKWQNHIGILTTTTDFDLLTNQSTDDVDKPELPINSLSQIVELSDPQSPPFISCHLPDGSGFVVGYSDGLIEIRDPRNGEVKSDLLYQSQGNYMIHENDNSVLSLFVTKDSKTLLSGDRSGTILVWDIVTGQLMKTITKAHDGPILSLRLSHDENLIISGSEDNTARIHGLRSGNTLRKFVGHASHVIYATFTQDMKQVITASKDGRIILWNAEQMKQVAYHHVICGVDHSLNCIVPITPHGKAAQWGDLQAAAVASCKDPLWLLCSGKNSRTLSIVQVQWSRGGLQPSFTEMKSVDVNEIEKERGCITHLAASTKGEYMYCCDETGSVYCVEVDSGGIVAIVPNIGKREPDKLNNCDLLSLIGGNTMIALGSDGYGRLLEHQ
eukprot:GHVH01010507.1.p1 GENE.GHVH01010507.1~~GHVH01010507.1.p1  ORF type:complete len:577 (-),score=73.36 GHVH01010507.1:2344-3828(-)